MTRGLVGRATHAVRYFLLRRLPACRQMAALMSESMERPLTLRERVTLRLHLWACIWCVWYLEQLQLLRAGLRERAEAEDSAADINLSLEARERIKRALKGGS
ncbi:MAG TPA: hypothetical protein VK421_17720 [Pyrinomonadaceae bacterium]|nr:hypothetical protein [Pyrinomonadaceae bacterium]